MVGQTISLAASLRDTGPNGNVGRQTHWTRSLKLNFPKENASYVFFGRSEPIRSPGMPMMSDVPAPASTYSQWCTEKPARTGPVEAGLSAMYVECGRKSFPRKMLTRTHTHKQINCFKVPYPRMRSYTKRLLFALARLIIIIK